MSIERFADIFTPTCDMCSVELPEEFSFEEAVYSKGKNGWRSVCDSSGEWWDLCPECYRKHGAKIQAYGPSEFGGVK